MSVPATSTFFQPVALPEPLMDLFERMQLAASKPGGPIAAHNIIAEYCHSFNRGEIHRNMWMLYSAASCNQQMPGLRDTEARHNLLYFYEFTLMLLDAVYELHGRADTEFLRS